MEYADNACNLSRPFSGAGQTYQLALTLQPTETDLWLRLGSKDKVKHRDSGKAVVEIDGSRIGSDVHFNIFANGIGGTTREFWLLDYSKLRPLNRSLRLIPARYGDFILSAADFAAALKALDNCRDDLHRSLGIDPALLKTVAVEPSGDLPLSEIDYPRKPGGFDIALLFWVDASGTVDDCRVLKPSKIPQFDSTICLQLQKKARYKPARDASGAAIRAPVHEDIRLRTEIVVQ